MGTNIWTGMSETAKRHMRAICSGQVDKTNVIGLRKILNAQWRKDSGYSVSGVAPKVTRQEVRDLEREMEHHQPRVVGRLHESGLKLLQDKRYRKRLEPVADIIANLDCFRLIGYTLAGNYDGNYYPVYRAIAKDGRKFTFYNVPWQSGGNGPQLDPYGYSGPNQ